MQPEAEPEQSSRFVDGAQLLQHYTALSAQVPIDKAEPVYKPLRLLKLLHLLNQSLPLMLSPGTIFFKFPISPISYQALQSIFFLSHKLNALLVKQLSDMLSMVGGMSPDWRRFF